MKDKIQHLVVQALATVLSGKDVAVPEAETIQVENTRDPAHGDLATNVAMTLAKRVGMNPRQLAEQIIEQLPAAQFIEKTDIAGPGFINFFLSNDAYYAVVGEIFKQGEHYGESDVGQDTRVLLEFVSANPTGPLHIGHGRGAAYGATVASLLKKAGFDVTCEYYINDAGRQMDILAVSVWFRYLQLTEDNIPFPDNAYRGDYIRDIASKLHEQYQEQFLKGVDAISGLMAEADAERKIDRLIEHCKSCLGNDNYNIVFNAGLEAILKTINDDLREFGVSFDNWYSERSLVESDQVTQCLARLVEAGVVYEKDGAKWFASSRFGDEKDRVLVRDNGQATYFASDVAYHMDKFERGFNKIINIWGADHHGYIPRVKASIQALGHDDSCLEVLLVQFATLYRGTEKLQMSTRSGEFITLNQLQNEVGKDAARFFYILRKSEQHLDFDLELAKSQSNDNPVYYIQYAHARICSVFRQLDEKGFSYSRTEALTQLATLTEPHELKLLATLARFPEVIVLAAKAYEPHQLAYYLRDLANEFHGYYNANQFLVEDEQIRNARLALVDASKQVLQNGLSILGVSAPEMM